MQLMHSPGKIPLFSELGLLVLLAWMVSGWLLPGEKVQLPGQTHDTTGSAAVLVDLTDLLAIPLFGQIPVQEQSPKSVVKKAAPVVQSKLTLKLLGTVVSGEESAAIISLSEGSDQQVFLVGEIIQPGVTLHKVESWAIVVDRKGMLERISLEQGASLSAMPMAVKKQAGFPPVVMSHSKVKQQLGNLPALLSQARAVPHYTNGKPNGFVITEIIQGSLYQQAGLLNGDIILKVNGRKITSAEQAMSMYQELQNAAAIDLELMRAGQMKQVHYDVR